MTSVTDVTEGGGELPAWVKIIVKYKIQVYFEF